MRRSFRNSLLPALFLGTLLGFAACTSGVVTPTPNSMQKSRSRRLQPGELLLAAEKDDIPAINALPEMFINANRASELLDEREPVVVILQQNESKAYPIKLLSLHEVINDKIGSLPILITWCPLCYSALGFRREVDGSVLTFGVSGYLYHSNLVMYDRQSNTLWNQVLGQGLKGAFRGRKLQPTPVSITSLGIWLTQHPETQVLAGVNAAYLAEIVDPYSGYYRSGAVGLGEEGGDDRLPGKELVVGVKVGSLARAWPVSQIQTQGVIEDTLGEEPLLLVYDKTLQTVHVYSRRWQTKTLSFTIDKNVLRDRQTDSVWDINSARAVSGALANAQLQRVNAPLIFWFAWSGIYPETDVNTIPQHP